jgi:UDPglucose 6-dehydrogenase
LVEIGVIGLGYVGLTTALGLVSLGHKVSGIDTNVAKTEILRTGKVPFFEEGMEPLLRMSINSKNLSLQTSWEKIPSSIEIFFVCVPTPFLENGHTDLAFIHQAIKDIISKAKRGATVVIKSTAPIGTAAAIEDQMNASGLFLANNPEFLQEGTALRDFNSPTRIVVGSSSQRVSNHVMSLYKDLNCPKIETSLTAAETIKYASNAFLALRLSFANELAEACEKFGADVDEVLSGVGLDPRIGPYFLAPGPGWGGSCFPKDTKELIQASQSRKFNMFTIEAAVKSNRNQQNRIVERIETLLGGNLEGKTIAVWGLAFKAGTDDTRDSPALAVIELLTRKGAMVAAFDPMVSNIELHNVVLKASAKSAVEGANCLIVLTEWPEFSEIDPKGVSEVMRESIVLDARRILNRDSWQRAVTTFSAIGKL